jgi:CDP-paratose 2-epimerase
MIGFNIAKHYAPDHEVVVIDNLERSKLLGHEISPTRRMFNADALNRMGVWVIHEDVSKRITFEGLGHFDRIFHMAAQCGVPTSVEDPRRDFEVNTVGTLNVLEHARLTGGKVVYASTNKVYPIHDEWERLGERWEWRNQDWRKYGFPVINDLIGSRTPYGNSKYMGDLLCQEYHHMYGVPTGVFRMSCIYGRNQFSFEEQGWITWFAIANLKGLPINVYGDGFQTRDILHVSDVVAAYNAYMDSDVAHGVWNLGGSKNVISIREAIAKIETITGKSFVDIQFFDWRPSDQKVYTSDIRPLVRQLGWRPKVGMRDGIKDMIEWVKEVKDVF